MAAIALIVVVAVSVMYVTGIGCPVLFFTGISCFGCGMTRACLALLHLDFAEAWQYHPMVFLMPVAAGVLLFSNRIPKKVFQVLATVFFALFIIVYLVRLSDPENLIVTWNISDGFLYKLLIK